MIAAALASSPPPLPGFLNALSGILQQYGLWAIGLLITLEDFGVPVPGETILIAGAIYAGAGKLNIVALGVVAFVAAVARARASTDDELPETTGGALPNGPPPAHRWAERDPAAAARLAAARAAITALAEENRLPVENLLSPDALRRLSWDPPEPCDGQTVAQALAGYGARPWQIELTAEPVTRALRDAPVDAKEATKLGGSADPGG